MEEEQKTLEQILKLSEENNKLLKKMNRSIQWGRFFRLIYWVLIIGSAVGAYYFLQPVFESFKASFDSLGVGVKNLQNIGGSLPDVSAFLENLQSGQ